MVPERVTDDHVVTSRVIVVHEVHDDGGNPLLEVLDATTLEYAGGRPLPIDIAIRDLTVAADGGRAIAVQSAWDHQETRVVLVDVNERRILRSTPIEQEQAAQRNAVGDDGHTVAVGCGGGEVRIVDARTGATSPAVAAHDGVIDSISFAPDVKSFVTAGED